MSNEEKRSGELVDKKTTIFYSFAGIADTMSYQMFTFYIFNFYYTVVIGDILLVSLGYILWSVWNAFNDPLIGILSDRTSTKWGRRKPYIIAGIIPTCILVILLWTAPLDGPVVGFIYFIIIINLFDTFYTAYSLNQTSLFPEMYQDLKQRAKANQFVAIFNIIGLLFAVLLPALMVSKLLGPEDYTLSQKLQLQMEFIVTAIVMAVLAAIFAAIFILRGIRERKEYSKDPENAPSFVGSLKYTFKNKAFRTYVITNFAQWYLFGIIPIMNPYFFQYILQIENALIQNIFLAIIFVSAICFMLIWRNYFSKHGAKKGHGAALLVTIITMIPFTFIGEIVGAIITYILLGFGFAGIMFGRDVIFSAIIDKDEIDTGVRREGGYYGINALVIRFSTIAVALSLLIVFPTVGWYTWAPTVDPIIRNIGIRVLMFAFPAVALGLGFLCLLRFPINQKQYFEIREKLEEIHSEKLRKVSGL